MTEINPEVKVGQVWRRKRDGVLVHVRRGPFGAHSFVSVRSLESGRVYEVTPTGLRRNYEIHGEES